MQTNDVFSNSMNFKELFTKEKNVGIYHVNYLFDINKDNINTYFKMKNKHYLSFTEKERKDFYEDLRFKISQFLKMYEFDVILIPETTNTFFMDMVSSLGHRISVLKKRKKLDVLNILENHQMMKAERLKLISNIQSMNDIKIGLIAANQRNRIARILFEERPELNTKKIVFLDDSVFTGYTLNAINEQYHCVCNLVLFSN